MEAILATLLKFEGRKKSSGSGAVHTGEAQILIFTGVRYERQTPPPKDEFDNKRRKRKRG